MDLMDGRKFVRFEFKMGFRVDTLNFAIPKVETINGCMLQYRRVSHKHYSDAT